MALTTVWRMVQFDGGESGWAGSLLSRRKTIANLQLTFHPEKEQTIVLLGLHVEPEWRGQGYAKLLMEQMEQEFSDRFGEVVLVVQPFGELGFNTPELVEFYKRRGYEATGRVTKGCPIMRKQI